MLTPAGFQGLLENINVKIESADKYFKERITKDKEEWGGNLRSITNSFGLLQGLFFKLPGVRFSLLCRGYKNKGFSPYLMSPKTMNSTNLLFNQR